MNTKVLGKAVLVLGLVCLVVGGIFIWQSFDVKATIADGLRDEQLTLGIPQEGDEGYNPDNLYVDTAAEAQVAHDTILEHMRDDPGRYADTERGSAERDHYVDGITLRNSLTIAMMGFGVTTIALGIGAGMLVVGFALGITGWALNSLNKT